MLENIRPCLIVSLMCEKQMWTGHPDVEAIARESHWRCSARPLEVWCFDVGQFRI